MNQIKKMELSRSIALRNTQEVEAIEKLLCNHNTKSKDIDETLVYLNTGSRAYIAFPCEAIMATFLRSWTSAKKKLYSSKISFHLNSFNTRDLTTIVSSIPNEFYSLAGNLKSFKFNISLSKQEVAISATFRNIEDKEIFASVCREILKDFTIEFLK